MSDIWPVLARIGAELDGDHSLDALARGAGLSPFQFHRWFSDAMGETPKRYVARLRLERAALRLRIERASIVDIALSSGFANHETFARAFRRHFGQSPSEYRAGGAARATEPPALTRLPSENAAFEVSATRLRMLADLDIVFVRHTGPYENAPPNLWERLRAWAPATPILVGIAHDAPGITPPDKLRFDAGIVLPPNTVLPREAPRQTIVGGPHAVTTYAGGFEHLAHGYARAFAGAAQLAGYETIGLPCLEFYRAQSLDLSHAPPVIEIAVPMRAR